MSSDIKAKYWPYEYESEWFDLVSKMNIHQRIHGAMTDAKPVAKTQKDGIKFKFHGHEGVSAMVKALAEKWRFVIEASVIERELQVLELYGKPRPLCVLTVRVRFVNIDNPTDYMEAVTVGYGVDESDKGPGKALSYAIKMAELKTFSIHDGEKLDNEEFCYEHEREEKRIKEDKAKYNEAKQEWAQLVRALKLTMTEEGARLKREYGDPPTLEGILIDCDEMKAELAKMASKKNGKASERPKGLHPSVIHSSEVPPDPELLAAVAGMSAGPDYSDLLDDQPSFVDQG